jgi:putative transposase
MWAGKLDDDHNEEAARSGAGRAQACDPRIGCWVRAGTSQTLRVPQRRRRNRLGTSTAPGTPIADAPNRVWALDFQFDATTDGRPIKIVSIIDEHTRECLGRLVARSITADVLIDELDRLATSRGYPGVLHATTDPN